MSTIRVEDLPDDLYLKLKFSAAVNHNSIDKEIICCLEKVLTPEKRVKRIKQEKARYLFDQIGHSYKAEDLRRYIKKVMTN